MKDKKTQNQDMGYLHAEINEFYDKVREMEADEFYEKYRELHKKVLFLEDGKILLGYLRDIKEYYESQALQKNNKTQNQNMGDLHAEINEFYDKIREMKVDEFYEKYRELHKKVLFLEDGKILLGYLRDIKGHFESRKNYDLQSSIKRSSLVVPLIVAIISGGLVVSQIIIQKQTSAVIADMISPPLSYEQYFPPEKFKPLECNESAFVVVNCGDSKGEYEIIIRGSGFLISDNCGNNSNGEILKSRTWTIPPDSNSQNTFGITIDMAKQNLTASFKISVIDLEKNITIFEQTYVYKRYYYDPESPENFYYRLIGSYS